MGKKLYIGNLPYSATESVIVESFSQCGKVESAQIVVDRVSGRSKGFAFVEMSTDEEAAAVIKKFDEADYDGRPLKVSEAKPMVPREDRSGKSGPRGDRA